MRSLEIAAVSSSLLPVMFAFISPHGPQQTPRNTADHCLFLSMQHNLAFVRDVTSSLPLVMLPFPEVFPNNDFPPADLGQA
jgi:hypothetical protein